MSYPQPIASQEVIEGQEFFRLNTQLDSYGDAYEMDVSAKAFVVGPQSDLNRFRVTYYDPQLAGNAQSLVVTTGDFFSGRIDALASGVYPSSNAPGRIVITPLDMFYPDFRVISHIGGDYVSFQNPRLDVLGYLSQPNVAPAVRADFTLNGRVSIPNSEGGGIGNMYFYLPWYGRKYASFVLTNFTGAGYAATIFGVLFSQNGITRNSEKTLLASTAIPATGPIPLTAVLKASTVGLWDYLVLQIRGGVNTDFGTSPLFYQIRFTDIEV